MAVFTVNGKTVTAEKNQKLLRFLRDELRLTSVKDGCSEGACGTCTVLIDGKPTKACVPQTDKLEGKNILTVEGLSDWEKKVYTWAFGEAGAVQCGFCIPGMVISAKALLDTNPDPSREEAAFAIRNNICRCTGYVKIIDGILLAAKCFREDKLPEAPVDWKVGSRVHRVDVEEKVTGTGQYPDDVYLDGMLYGSAVRSQYPRARVLAIHTEEAKALPGVVCVLTAADIPGINKVGHLKKDWDTMIAVGDITHYLGDAICLVAAKTPEALAQAKALVKVDYEELPAVHNPQEAILPDAPLVHREGNLLAHKHIQRGNPAEALAKSKYLITRRFSTPWTEHAFLEPECAVACPDGDGVLVLSTDQGAYDTQHEIMGMLGLPAEQVKVRNCLVGGGFGGKEDVTVQHHAALIAYLTKRPVKVKLTRAESLLIHPKRHPMEMEFSLGCDENGIIQGAAPFWYNTGVYPISLETASNRMQLNLDGTVTMQCGETEIGQGADTAYAQMTAKAVGLKSYKDVHVVSCQDTDITPTGLGAYASRQTYMEGFAIDQTGRLLRQKILAYAAEMLNCLVEDLDIVEGNIVRRDGGAVEMDLSHLAMTAQYNPVHSEHITAESTATIRSNAYSFGCTFAEVEVDIPMCKVTLKRIVNIHDCGSLINPALAEAQVHGGMSMGIGYGLSEQLLFDEKTGKPLNNNLLDYKLSTVMDHPDLEALFVENAEPTSPFGTKALGEPPACSPAPAIRSAIYNATGVSIDTTPITPHVLYRAFKEAGLIHDEKEGD